MLWGSEGVNSTRLAIFPLRGPGLGGTKGTAMQTGGVLQYKLEVYVSTVLKSSGGWAFCILQIFILQTTLV